MRDGLGVRLIANGVEPDGELDALGGSGICSVQAFLFARPAFARLPAVEISPPVGAVA